ncbi:hypothetical protein [Fluviispira multicolorata]|uniref:Uncharacterized protein n=1 Tax=Fluviispira multicolorata TaxID=2654512 RepID=A0A833N3B7_9BACT|nr:hypothetical protein [Fluviispira multicolorata]KAB8028119.1 hypothetical protein GCL57_13795 [Fluviispira multicolorata]
MSQPERLNEISGWILPCGKWYDTEEWWHINALYDLRDSGLNELQNLSTLNILSGGDEAQIRDHVASLGFIKISRNQLDGVQMSRQQLSTLQSLLLLCDPEQEVGILIGNTGIIKNINISRIMKLKNPVLLFEI